MIKKVSITLINKIREYNAAYRIGRPQISDYKYDALVEELREADPDNEWFKQIEPAPVCANRKRNLPIPMKSLNKVKSLSDINLWVKSIGLNPSDLIVITPKFDGVSLLHNEESGEAYSRGGAANEGQDCTAHYNAMRGWVYGAPKDALFTFGEFVFSKDKWKEYFAGRISPDTGEPYKSPRNTAAGMINRDIPISETIFVDFFRYGIDEESLEAYTTYTQLYKDLCSYYNQPLLMVQCRVEDLSDPLLLHIFGQFSQSYFIDGLVLYIDNLKKWRLAGRHEGTGNPRYAIAYKNPTFNETFVTTVKGIEWKMNKSGAMKPVVNIEPVDTGDCTMENPTGYNARWIVDNGIGPDAQIVVTRSGGVIPKILETLKRAKVALPSVCPHCGCPLRLDEKELVCTNHQFLGCDGVNLAKIIFFFKTIEAKDMGEEMFNKLFANGFKTIKSILNIKESDILKIDGFGDGTAEVILREMAKIKQGVNLITLMHASDCFKTIGQAKAKDIIHEMSEEKLQAFVDGTLELKSYRGESVTKKHFRMGYPYFIKFIRNLKVPIIMPSEPVEPLGSRYVGFRVCFSGVRDSALETEIVKGGGAITSNVSGNTTHLVVKDQDGISSKITKARKLGVPILSLESFKAQF